MKINISRSNQRIPFNGPRLFSHRFSTVEETESARLLDESCMVWIDMEMTGLDVEKEKIMEIACIITDKNVNIVAMAEDLILKVRSKWFITMSVSRLSIHL